MKTPQKLPSKKYKGFTLVELIVVITILVILGTIAFIQLQGFSGSARDSARIENLSNLQKGLTLFQIKSGTYPIPENPVNITASGTIIGYQGFAKDQIGSIAKLSKGGTIDPLDATMYTTYSVNTNQTKMQIMTFLEDSSTAVAFVPTTYASATSDYSKRSPIIMGDSLGILLGNNGASLNQPVQELYNASSFTGVDIVNTTSGYLAIFAKGNSVSGTGNVLAVVSSMGAKSCNDLFLKDTSKKNKDGIYYINPTMSNSGTFQVYCDMTTDGGGWSLVVRIKADGTGNHGSGSAVDILMSPNQANLAKLSDTTINQIKNIGIYKFTCRDKIGYYKFPDGIWNSRHKTSYGSGDLFGSDKYNGIYIEVGHASGSSYGLANYMSSTGYQPFGWHQDYFPTSFPSEGGPNYGCYETTGAWGGDGTVWVK